MNFNVVNTSIYLPNRKQCRSKYNIWTKEVRTIVTSKIEIGLELDISEI